MDFGSKYVYDYSDSEEECVSDEEFEQGMTRVPSVPVGGAGLSAAVPNVYSEMPEVADEEIVVAAATADHSVKEAVGATDLTNKSSESKNKESSKVKLPTPSEFVDKMLSSQRKYAGPKAVFGSAQSFQQKQHHWVSPGPETTSFRSPAQRQDVPQGRRWRRADTNVVNVKFDTLKAPSNMHTGDPFHCSNCAAVLSKLSKLREAEADSRIWTCEFCDTVNKVDLVDEEIPTAEDTTFMMCPAPSTQASGRSGKDETLIIFCMDVSGSMCVTTEVPGTIRMRGSYVERMKSLSEPGDSQFYPGQRRNVTYVSRLQGLQAAVDQQLEDMVKEQKDHRRVALITFDTEVTVIGDGSGNPVHISGDKLNNKEELMKIGSELAMPKPIKDSREILGKKLFELDEAGQTALGPALLVGVSMACQIPGAKVIMCTDGKANIGLGNLEGQNSEEGFQKAAEFFDEVASVATDKGVSVSVISIKGTDCKMVELGKVADATGGQVNIVDPLKLAQEFGSILADPIIATNVSATLQLHKGLYFRFEASELSKVTRYVGNVTKNSEITFEYGIRGSFKRKQKERKRVSTVPEEEEPVYDNQPHPATGGDAGEVAGGSGGVTGGATSNPPLQQGQDCLSERKELPFQLQIKYTDLEGAQALRVISQTMPITTDRQQAENEMNMAAIGSHATKTSAALALQGDYTQSRMNAFMYQRLLHRKASTRSALPEDQRVYDNFYSQALPMENRLTLMQRSERSTRGITLSDEEEEEDGVVMAAGGAALPAKKKHKKKEQTSYMPSPISMAQQRTPRSMTRRMECDDESANVFYDNLKVNSKKFQKK